MSALDVTFEISSSDEDFAAVKTFVGRVTFRVKTNVFVQIGRIAEGTEADLAFQWLVTLRGE